jgi:surface polysaccharide O-acyltransferase-like enzyme
MDEEQIKTIIEDIYDESRENSIWSMVGDFYNRKMLSTAIFIWVWGLLFCVGAIFSAIQFFKTTETQSQIMYAVLFLCFCQFLGLMKIFAWQMIHRNGLKREIKRLELRVAELNETVKGK